MITASTVRQMVLKFDHVEEVPHFEKPSFRIRKKIFATLDVKHHRVCLKMTEVDQDLYTLAGQGSVYPVPNAWGKQGWTYFELTKVRKKLLGEALSAAYLHVSKKPDKTSE